MRNKSLILTALFIFAGAGTALASSAPVDPSIILRDPASASCVEGPTCINTSNFTFNVGGTGGGLFEFTNNLGGSINSLVLILQNPGGINNGNIGTAVNCQVQSYFQSCDKSVLNNGSIRIFFFGVGGDECSGEGDDEEASSCNGIPNGQTFALDLFDQVGGKDSTSGGWVANSSVGGVANTPEPGSLLLLLTGIPLIALRKRH